MDVLIWRPVKNYEGLYEINKDGEVRSLHKRNFEKIMPQRIGRGGYNTVRLSKNGRDSTKYVHRLLGFAFIINPDNKPIINHKDCNKLNNHIDNLEWVNQSENMKHAYNAGVLYKNLGANHHEAVRLQSMETGELFETIKEAAEKAGVNYNTFRNSLNSGTNYDYLKIAG
ncbi:NUMOD4 domain-containing protein [Flavihumibacter profundi]|uniref:NUMOD4 domain-containing protein n=1 Tax=Flavihumibacter profundi TaxID=2716883 RepID=UPI001CC64381|nr:NUMOD4 domain-containing protein [Flavihumibacter profundi]MBZ5857775.1 NUMOD4 motif-containing HNH endonuclease [Flavihumibacter profundi]